MYNQLRPLAFRMVPEAITEKQRFSAYPFWVLGIPENFKKSVRQAVARISHRSSEEKVQLPIHALNRAARMLIPDLISITRYAGQTGVQPWLYGFINEANPREPASSEAMKMILRSWIQNSLHKNLPPAAKNVLLQQLAVESLIWQRKTIDLTHWDQATNLTAKPYREKTIYNNFILLPDLIAARLSKEEIIWGPHHLKFRRAPLSPGKSGVELISWPPIDYPEGNYVWPFSVVLTLTLQTIPFQPFPELHCDLSIRRWAGPEISYLPGRAETSVYLLDQVPWIDGIQHSSSFQIASIMWEYIPASERKEGELPYRLGWDSSLIQLLNDLHPKDAFPDPQKLKKNPYSFIHQNPSIAIVFRNGIKPSHGAGPGLMPRDRHLFAEQLAALLQPEFAFIPAYERKEYRVHTLPNPFFAKQKTNPQDEDTEDSLAGTDIDRRMAIAQTTKKITIEIWYQSEEIHQALREAIQELLGYPLSVENGYTWSTPEITIKVRSQHLGALGDALTITPGSYETLYDRVRNAINQRAIALSPHLQSTSEAVGALIELDAEDKFDDNDPKVALRIDFGRKRYHSQFITPQPEAIHPTEKNKLQKQLKERTRSAVRDLLRQFGVLGLPPLIQTKPPRKKSAIQIIIPESLHYLGFWLIKQDTKSSTTHIAQTLPVLVHMASASSNVQVMAPGFKNWHTYGDSLFELLEQQDPKIYRPQESLQFLLETLDKCLPFFGDTLLFCHAQNLRGTWKWLNNEQITKTLPAELSNHSRLRIIRLRTEDHEIPEWYAQSEKEAYGFSQGLFSIGDSGHVFASVQKKPPTAMLSKELSKVLTQTKLDKKTQTIKEYYPRPDISAWNAGICEMTIACTNSNDALMCAIVTNELRHHFASHFGSPTVFPLPLHLASLIKEYLLPLTKSLKSVESTIGELWEEEE